MFYDNHLINKELSDKNLINDKEHLTLFIGCTGEKYLTVLIN